MFSTLVFTLALAVSVTSPHTNVVGGDEFELNANVTGFEPSSTYYIKALGGDNNYEVLTKNNESWLSWNSSWDSMPQFVSPEATESATLVTVKGKFKDDSSGTKDVKVRIRKVDLDENYDSNLISILVTAKATPTPTATATASPSPTPTTTATPSPSPTPTKKPTPKPTTTNTSTPSPSPTPVVLGEATSTPTVIDTATVNSSGEKSIPNFSILMVVGGLVLSTTAGFSIWKKYREENSA